MKYNIVNISFDVDDDVSISASKVRGFIGNQFNEYTILHNHYNNEKFLFTYPLVQYKIINNKIHILGIGEGGKIIKKIASEINFFDLDKKYDVKEKIISEKVFDIKPTKEEKHYKFITPWLGLTTKIILNIWI